MGEHEPLTLTGFLDALASNTPAPGGGSAAALAGAAGVSLLVMVAGLSASRARSTAGSSPRGADGFDMASHITALEPLRQQLITLIEHDSDAYRGVLTAYRLPRASDTEQRERREAIQAALRAATETPLDTLRACREALDHGASMAAHVLPSARSDMRVAVELLEAAARGAGLNVEANLASITDGSWAARIRADRERLHAACARDAARAHEQLTNDRPA